MKNNYKIIGIVIIILVSSCNSGQKNDNPLTVVDIEANMNKMVIINLSQVTDEIRYIPLESKENHLLSYINDIDILENRILVRNMTGCLLYDTSGHIISKIGTRGRGPGEYPFVTNAGLGKNGKCYLSDVENLYEYNIDGSFVKKYINNFLIDNLYYLITWYQISDSLFFGHVPNSTGQIEYKALLVDKQGDVKHYYKNYVLFNRGREIASDFENQAHIYQFNNDIFYKELFIDTLFSLTDQSELIPRYAFSCGKFKEPVSERENIKINNHMVKYIYVYHVFQTEKYLFIDCNFGDQFPAKRLTPKQFPIPTINPMWYNTRSILGIFNKRTGTLVFCKPTSTDNPLFTSGFYNDIDAGPRFFPSKQVNDSTLAMWVTSKDLKDHIASDDFKNNTPKHPEKKSQLEELANSLSEFDNPVLMFVTFKK